MNLRFALPLLFALASCRADPGVADYSSHVGLQDQDEEFFLAGPTPFDPSQPRLNFGGIEGRSTESIQTDGASRFFFLFDTAGDGSGAFTVFADSSTDRIEGFVSLLLEHQGTGFWGAGFFWYIAEDISEYENLYISAKSSDPAFADFDIRVQSGADRPPNPEDDEVTEASVSASAYGYVNDGEWHNLVIPVADFEAQGVDFRRIRSPAFFNGGAGESGEALRLDNIFYE
jgi:hypothetical protein